MRWAMSSKAASEKETLRPKPLAASLPIALVKVTSLGKQVNVLLGLFVEERRRRCMRCPCKKNAWLMICYFWVLVEDENDPHKT